MGRGAALSAALVVVAGGLLFVAAVGHRPLAYLTRDPQATTLQRWFLGFFSNVGSACWWGATGIAIFAGIVVSAQSPGARSASFILAVGGLTAVFGFDDMFGIHDIWGYQVGLPEWPFFALYGGLAVALIVRYRREVETSWLTPFVLAIALYALSTVADWLSGHSESDLRYLGEDGVKLLAIVCWTGWVGHTAFTLLTGRPPDEDGRALPYD
ncbi:MAG: hypothetical protein JWL83_943 [Actinomycetia bacterium]|nr:hypothetical protein [Actinomycetes bacterium]